jgi:HAD superfamily hydrolase (TIGR01490 family)
LANLVIFDLDGTLASVNVSFAFSKYLYQNKILSLSKMLALASISFAQKLGLCTIEMVHHLAFRIVLLNKSQEDDKRQIDAFLKLSLPTLFRPELLQCLLDAQDAKSDIWLLSSSPECIVAPIAEHLGVHTVLATRYSIEDGRYKSLANIVTGKEKRAFLIEHAQNRTATAYTDSINDLPLLEAVTTPIAVYPDRKLKQLALKRHWQIIQ